MATRRRKTQAQLDAQYDRLLDANYQSYREGRNRNYLGGEMRIRNAYMRASANLARRAAQGNSNG